MDVDYSLNTIRVQNKGFFYKGERKVKYSEFQKLSDTARHKRHWRELMKKSNSWANKLAKKQYKFYLWQIEHKFNLKPIARKMIEAVKLQSEARNTELLDQETLGGIITGPVTRNILKKVITGAITIKTIRDAHVQDFLKDFDRNRYPSWDFHQFVMKKRQFGSESLTTASGKSDKETD